MMVNKKSVAWAVLNQSQSEVFQNMVEAVSVDVGRCLLITGNRFEYESQSLHTIIGPSYSRGGLTSRAVSWLRFAIFAFWKTRSLNRDVLIVTTTNPPFLALVPLIWSLIRGNRFVILVWDVYPDHLITLGLITRRNPIYKLWELLNRKCIEKCSVLVTISEEMADILRLRYPAASHKTRYIPNFTCTKTIVPCDEKGVRLREELGLLEKRVVLYAGNMGASHALESVVRAAEALKSNRDIHFIFVGDGLKKTSVVQLSKDLELENVSFMPRQSERDFRSLLALGDIGVVAQTSGTSGISLPSKVYTYMAAGLSILAITDLESSLGSLVEKHNIGYTTAEDPSCVAEAIRRLTLESGLLQEFKENAREACRLYYDKDIVGIAWSELIKELIA